MPIVIPRREVWTRQPQQAVGIDWSNPLTSSLVSAVLPSGGLGNIDRVSGQWVNTGGVNTILPRSSGNGFILNGSSQSFDKTSSVIGNIAAGGGFTLAAVAVPTSSTVRQTLIGLGRNASTTPFVLLGVGNTAGKGEFSIRDDASTLITLEPGTFSAGSVVTVIGVQRSASERYAWLNGSKATNTTTNSALTLDRTSIGCLLRSTSSIWFGGAVLLACIWNRALSDKEVSSFCDNPWQIFQP